MCSPIAQRSLLTYIHQAVVARYNNRLDPNCREREDNHVQGRFSNVMTSQDQGLNDFYEELFIHTPEWNQPEPNVDEACRWSEVCDLLARNLQGEHLRIIDVGCGRGWMTNLLTQFGSCEGLDPVAPVISHARSLFTSLTFHVGDPHSFGSLETYGKYDVLVASEVLEHVVNKESFLLACRALLKLGGLMCISTPRAEIQGEWIQVYGAPSQPVEEWIDTKSLLELLRACGLEIVESRTTYAMDIYQVHLVKVV